MRCQDEAYNSHLEERWVYTSRILSYNRYRKIKLFTAVRMLKLLGNQQEKFWAIATKESFEKKAS